MRISNGMIYRSICMSVQKNMSQMTEVQQQISSGVKIHKPSDAPVILGRLLDLNMHYTRTDTYVKSINIQVARLERAETALMEAADILQRAKDIAVEGSNGDLCKSSAEAFAQEVDILIDDMIAAASRSQGRVDFVALFERDNTANPEVVKYTGKPVNYAGHEINSKIFDSELLNDTLDPEEVFTPAGGKGVFETLIELRDAFITAAEAGGSNTAVQETLGDLDNNLDILLAKRTGIGAKINRLEILRVQLEDQSFSLNESMVELQSVDIAEASIRLSECELAYRAALSATSIIMRTGLMDYLT